MSIARHTLYNVAGSGTAIIVSIATVPLYLSVVGLERYGVLSICWLLLGYFGLFDLGLGRAASQKIAALGDAEAEQRSSVFWSALTLSIAISTAALILLVPAARIAFEAMNFESAHLRREAIAAVPWVAAALPLGVANGVLAGALTGRERFLAMNLVTSASTVASAAAPLLVAIFIGPELRWLVAASLATRAASMMAMFLICMRAVPLCAPRWLQKQEAAALLRFGGWTTVGNIVAPLLVSWDRFAIGAIMGTAAVGVYVIPFNVIMYLLILPGALAVSAFPRMSRAAVGDDDLQHRATEMTAILMAPVVLFSLLVLGPFFYYWIGQELAVEAAPVAYILLVGLWMNSIAQVPAASIQARGKPKVVAILHVLETIPYMAILIASIYFMGLVGAALTWSLRCFFDCLILIKLSRTPLRQGSQLIVYFLLIVTGTALSFALPLWSPLRLVLLAAILLFAGVFLIKTNPQMVSALIGSVWPHSIRPRSR